MKSQAKRAPCTAACPAGIDVPRYVRQVAAGAYADALATVRERIPFPLVCGYACFHPCEAKCGRAQYEGAVAIRMLKRVAAELAPEASLPPAQPSTGKQVAIIGSGPCGLTAAYYLALLGHAVTVFEAMDRSGGMLRYGIPQYRLPDAVIDADIALIEACGVNIVTGKRVASAEALLTQGYDAVLIASGAWRATKLNIDGGNAAHVLDGIAFLAKVNAGAGPAVGAQVVVIGGGDTAIDAARVSRRLGAKVNLVYRRSRAEMPASAEEIEAALEEGVSMEFLTAPTAIVADELRCVRMELAEAGEDGRRRPIPVKGSEFSIPANTVIVAIGQQGDAPVHTLDRASDGTLGADAENLATSIPGIYAGGDAVTGPATIIDAIAQGRRAGSAIDRYLGGKGDLACFAHDARHIDTPAVAARGTTRERWNNLSAEERLRSFALVEQAYDTQAAKREAQRCLSCDLLDFEVRVDAALCKDCGYCKEVCALDVFARSDDFNASGYRPYLAEHSENCVGCLRCLYICPDFAISVDEHQTTCPSPLRNTA